MPVWLEILLVALAVARLTILLRADRITRPLRQLVWRNTSHDESLPRYLAVCAWCLSLWIGAGAAGAWYAWHGRLWFDAAALALAASYVTGVAATTGLEPASDEPQG